MEQAPNIGKSTAMMSGLVIISRITGFIRTWSQAFAVGVTVIASCYSVANALPNTLYEFVAAGILSISFLPVYISLRKKLGLRQASAYASNILSIVLILMSAITLISIIFAGFMIYTQSFSATTEFDSQLAEYFFRFFAIEIILYPLSSIFSGLLNAERDYFWVQAAPIFNNIIVTASFVLYAWIAPINPELGLLLLALGNPLGVLIQVILQFPHLKKHGIHLTWHINLKDPALKETLELGIPSCIFMAISSIAISIQSSVSLSIDASGASILYYSQLWYLLPYAILSVPITISLFTELSEQWSLNNKAAFIQAFRYGVNQIHYFMIPCAALLIVFASPLISIISAGRFSAEAHRMTSEYLMWRAFSLPLYSISIYLMKVTSSMRKMNIHAFAFFIATVVYSGLILAFTKDLGLNYMGFMFVLYYLISNGLVFIYVRYKLGSIGLRSMVYSLLRSCFLFFVAIGFGYSCISLVGLIIPGAALSFMGALVTCILAGLPALLLTFAVSMLLQFPEAAGLQSVIRRFFPRRKAA